ncbi:MAG: M48 family metallopeptidase [Woeseia sp.]
MNFFEAQDRARQSTRWLLAAYVAATLLIVAGVTIVVGIALYTLGTPGELPKPSLMLATAIFTAVLILGSTIYKTSLLSAGGSRVATDLGGTLVAPDVKDPQRRRLRNVVEEMAIASGLPVPDIYVLEAEEGINAFAAGYTPGDAAIAVTRGALEVLNRDELQGVIAHEFSHVLNGDMRINIRMMGILFGIMVLSLIGRVVLRGSYHRGLMSSRRGRGAPAVMAIGAGMAVLGWIGVIFARLIKAAVSRQREMLADASAVQFTRQSQGLANALKKIGGYGKKSWIRNADPEEVSHMLFANGSRRLTSLFATHPPLLRRIRALDPSFKESDYPVVRPPSPHDDAEAPASEGAASFADRRGPTGTAALSSTASGDRISALVGNPGHREIGFARELRKSIPGGLHDAARSPQSSFLLALALVLDRSGNHVERQLHLLKEQLGPERTSLVKSYYDELQQLGVGYGLPLLEIAFPALKRRPAAQLDFLTGLVRRLIDADDQTRLYEYCFYKVLTASLDQSTNPAMSGSGRRVRKEPARKAALQLIRIVACYGHRSKALRDSAYAAGVAVFGSWAADYDVNSIDTGPNVQQLDHCLDLLQRIGLTGRRNLVDAIAATIRYDHELTLAEAELLRAICASLQCPLPPLVHQNPPAPARLPEGRTALRNEEISS